MKLKYFIVPSIMIIVAAIGFSKILKLNTATDIEYLLGKSYINEWKQVDSLLNLGQPETVLKVIDEVYKKAKAEDNYAQIVKAIIYKTNNNWHEENAEEKNIAFIEKELEQVPFPSKPLLQSILAEKYWNYYQNNRYKILQRTVTANFNNDDVQTWDAEKFLLHIAKLYEASLQNADSLKRVDLSLMDLVLITQAGSKNFRPTLYDFLAHRAIDFFSNDESGMTKPSDLFKIDNPNVFGDAKTFIALRVNATDTLSHDYKSLVLFRQITAFRIAENNVNALVDLELNRLKFMLRKAIVPNRDSLYLQALLKLESDFENDTISARTGFEIAQHYYEKANFNYSTESSAEANRKGGEILALEKCNTIIQKFPNTQGAHNCKLLKQQILQASLSLQVENVNVANKPFLVLINYKNLTQLNFKIIKADEQLNKLNDRYEQEKFIAELNKRMPETQWQQKLPETNDYRNHNTEIKINALPFGKYYLVASADKDFKGDSTQVVFAKFWISNLSFITKNNQEGNLEIYVLDRTSGHAVSSAEIKTYTERYNYTSREYDYKFNGNYKTNAEGYASIPGKGNYENFKLEIINKNDKLDLSDYFYTSRYRDNDRIQTRAFLFTDRAIYRPGQTVFFKGILLETFKKENKIKPEQTVTITLRDVNYQVVKEQRFTTNEYGTFSGNFILPSSGLNGNFTLIVENFGSKNFRVEDYKRPKFEVKFEPVKGSYQLNDVVEVKGNAKMYAGSNVDEAQVKYRVVRNARYPIWWGWWWRSQFPSSPEQEIISGETKTDAEGNFKIRFNAIPDFSLDKKNSPIFTYTVYADVTDMTGETRSSQVAVSVGYVALEADLDLKETLLNNEAARVKIITQNLNGEFEAAKGTIVIHQLTAPDKLLRKKLWQQPSQFLLKENEYEKEFPLDEYNAKNDFSEWKKGKQVLSRTFNTEVEKELVLKELVSWEQGAYIATLKTADKFGNEVKVEKYFTLLNAASKQMPYPKYDYFYAEKATAEPGEKAKLIIGSGAKDVKVLYELSQDYKVISRQWLSLNNEKRTIEIPVEEKHRGNLSATFAFVKDNRSYSFSQVITVPYTNKELKVEWETFRDKLAPGQKEQWKLKISGSKGEKVAAELLAGMYDASLDVFVANYWNFNIWQSSYAATAWSSNQNFRAISSLSFQKYFEGGNYMWQQYDELNWFNHYNYGSGRNIFYRGSRASAMKLDGDATPIVGIAPDEVQTVAKSKKSESNIVALEEQTNEVSLIAKDDNSNQNSENINHKLDNISPRTNLQETAFFFPNLETNAEGNVVINFTIPEALTRWKFMGFAHTKELQSLLFNNETVTQKDLMVFPNAPRFLREGDRISFSAKVTNLSEKDIEGTAKLTLLNALTLQPINNELGNSKPEITFEAKKGRSASLSWSLKIPQGIEAVTYRITAVAGNFTDSEESTLPVLTNRMLVTETLPLWIKSNQTKTFKLDKLIESGKGSATLKNQRLTLEFTSQPAWYAIQALPYLMEYPYECAEQTFNRLYANSLATHIVNTSPKVKTVFERWKNTDALLSNLSKNQELKNILLEETPWVMDAQNETERKKRVALLFDLNNMSQQTESSINKLEKMQLPNGGFPWFSGMRDNEYITLYILTGLGKLDKLNVIQLEQNSRYKQMALKAMRYCDDRMKEDYENLKKYKAKMDEPQIGYMQIQYLYARSFINKYVELPSSHKEAYNYYMQQAEKYWNKQNQYMKGMIALALHRAGNTKTPPLIMRSLEETAVKNEELGMYWKDLARGYYWYQAPIETQALMIEAFNEVSKNETTVDELRVWLLKNKQTNAWSNSKSTADACYSLLLSGTNWLSSDALVDITVGTVEVVSNGVISTSLGGVKREAGTGYFKTAWDKTEIKPNMGNVTLTKKDKGISWGALYWQYFEQLDKITPAATPLQLKKQLFLQENTKSGPRITPLTATTKLQPGDLVKVRIELRVDRDMEFVHMKDMRASGFEPTNVLSQYKWQGGLGYYESTRDAATHFFFDRLPKGTYVFEYSLRVSHEGDFSNGITTIQCMYAPEFASHSEGVRVKVE